MYCPQILHLKHFDLLDHHIHPNQVPSLSWSLFLQLQVQLLFLRLLALVWNWLNPPLVFLPPVLVPNFFVENDSKWDDGSFRRFFLSFHNGITVLSKASAFLIGGPLIVMWRRLSSISFFNEFLRHVLRCFTALAPLSGQAFGLSGQARTSILLPLVEARDNFCCKMFYASRIFEVPTQLMSVWHWMKESRDIP